jgi:hypothetical protein
VDCLPVDGPMVASERIGLPPEAIFLHAGWRTAGTWLWLCFRKLPDALGFYEPLHAQLATMRPGDVSATHARSWASGHPDMAAPYFAEYLPLLDRQRGGVRGFRSEFANECFFEDPPAAAPALAAYLRGIIDQALAADRRAVMKFCGGLGRAAWMMRAFPDALHVAVVTNPVSQWGSAWRQFMFHDNPGFVVAPFQILVRNQRHPRVGAMLEQLRVRLPRDPAEVLAHATALDEEARYRAFLAFWLLGMQSIPDGIHAVVNTDLLRLSAPYREATEQRLAELTGWPIGLASAQKPPQARPGVDVPPIERRALLACHRDAQDALTRDADGHGTDAARWGQIGGLLAFADLIGLEADAAPYAAAFGPPVGRAEMAAEAECLRQTLRQEQHHRWRAERQALDASARLAAVLGSTSWAVTAPLRLMGDWLRG